MFFWQETAPTNAPRYCTYAGSVPENLNLSIKT